jgi:hypothetical protein
MKSVGAAATTMTWRVPMQSMILYSDAVLPDVVSQKIQPENYQLHAIERRPKITAKDSVPPTLLRFRPQM